MQYLQHRNKGTLKPEALIPPSIGAVVGSIAHEFKVTIHGETFDIHVTGVSPSGESERRFYMTVDGEPEEVTLEMTGDMAGGAAATESRPGRRMRATGPGHVTAAMPGNVVEVLVKEGQSVNAGDPVLVIEAMKMETEIKAAVSGVVVSVFVKKGDRITPAETLLDIKP
jgi:pyruvate carboxylase subunit B